eukprot:14831-Heterococcus_DN1.PRE.4
MECDVSAVLLYSNTVWAVGHIDKLSLQCSSNSWRYYHTTMSFSSISWIAQCASILQCSSEAD